LSYVPVWVGRSRKGLAGFVFAFASPVLFGKAEISSAVGNIEMPTIREERCEMGYLILLAAHNSLRVQMGEDYRTVKLDFVAKQIRNFMLHSQRLCRQPLPRFERQPLTRLASIAVHLRSGVKRCGTGRWSIQRQQFADVLELPKPRIGSKRRF